MTDEQIEERILFALDEFRWGLRDGSCGYPRKGTGAHDDYTSTAYYDLGYQSGRDIRSEFALETHNHDYD